MLPNALYLPRYCSIELERVKRLSYGKILYRAMYYKSSIFKKKEKKGGPELLLCGEEKEE